LSYLVKVAAEGVQLEIILKYEPKVSLSVGLAKYGFIGLLGSIAALIDAVKPCLSPTSWFISVELAVSK
jgi:hypothetical protein